VNCVRRRITEEVASAKARESAQARDPATDAFPCAAVTEGQLSAAEFCNGFAHSRPHQATG
jgi:hypothetical protein